MALDIPMAETVGTQISIDFTAQGAGLYSQPDARQQRGLPDSDRFGFGRNQRHCGRQGVDLVTVMAHEFGHVIGLPDQTTQPGDLMYQSLGVGVRRLPTAQDVALVEAKLGRYLIGGWPLTLHFQASKRPGAGAELVRLDAQSLEHAHIEVAQRRRVAADRTPGAGRA